MNGKMNLSFAGCGFLGIYHVGVAACFKKYAPHLLVDKISGASAGAVAACCLLCDLPLGEITSDVLRMVREARMRTLGPFSPSFNVQTVLMEGLQKVLPDDAHIRVSGKLHISLTRVYDGKNVIVSQFNSKEDLLQALMASAFVPIFSGFLPPRFHGVRYMDGGFSDNLPTLDENTITVSPFCGESDICPRDPSAQLFHVNVANTSIELSKQNIYRFARILFPPKPEVLSNMCKQGFDDALRFLHRNDLISCTRCLAVQSTFVVSETVEEKFDYDPQCPECKMHRQEALVANLPDTVVMLFQDAIDSANKGLINWIFKHRGMKLLSILSLPYTLPADIVYAIFAKFMRSAPRIGNNLLLISKFLLEQLSLFLHQLSQKGEQMSANISCQLAVSEYGSKSESTHDVVKNKMNLNFSLNMEDKGKDECDISGKKCLSRKPSFSVNHSSNPAIDDDTFDHILQVTAHHDALMAFYYMDENNKVKVTEIFDVTEADENAESNNVAELREQTDETRILIDEDDCDEWGDENEPLANAWVTSNSEEGLDGYDAEDDNSVSSLDDADDYRREMSTIFSDAESEWRESNQTPLTRQYKSESKIRIDSRPESDQSSKSETSRPKKTSY